MAHTNEYGQPVGDDLGDWTSPEPIDSSLPLIGTYVRLEPAERARHTIPLFHAFRPAPASLWTYMHWGPFQDAADLGQLLSQLGTRPDWVPYVAVVDDEPLGMLCYLRMEADDGVIEIGGITLAPSMQRTAASTEAVFLLLDHAFDRGFRRVEWKCDALNAPSRRTAERLGFTYEGTFAKATHYKGRSRDTSWYAIVDDDWPRLRARIATWLDPDNFDETGLQRRRLDDILVGRSSTS